jgi:hypothetical protein
MREKLINTHPHIKANTGVDPHEEFNTIAVPRDASTMNPHKEVKAATDLYEEFNTRTVPRDRNKYNTDTHIKANTSVDPPAEFNASTQEEQACCYLRARRCHKVVNNNKTLVGITLHSSEVIHSTK